MIEGTLMNSGHGVGLRTGILFCHETCYFLAHGGTGFTTPTWAQMATSRHSAAAVKLAEGKMLVLGGTGK